MPWQWMFIGDLIFCLDTNSTPSRGYGPVTASGGGGCLDFKVLKFSGLKELWGSTLWGAWVPGFSLQGVGLENPPPRCKTIQAFQVAWRGYGYGRGCDFDGGFQTLLVPDRSGKLIQVTFSLVFFLKKSWLIPLLIGFRNMITNWFYRHSDDEVYENQKL